MSIKWSLVLQALQEVELVYDEVNNIQFCPWCGATISTAEIVAGQKIEHESGCLRQRAIKEVKEYED